MLIHLLVSVALLTAAEGEHRDKPRDVVARVGVGAVLSFVLDTQVTVGGVQLDLKKGVMVLTDVHIANPKGFEKGNAIEVQEIRVEADIKSLFSDAPMVQLVNVGQTSVNVEISTSHGISLKKLLENASRFTKGHKPSGEQPKKKFTIVKAIMEGADVSISNKLLGKQIMHKKLDRTEMNLSGQGGDGVTADTGMAKVLQTILDKLDLSEGTGVKSLLNILGK